MRDAYSVDSLINKTRLQFHYEWVWRLFLLLQLACAFYIIGMYIIYSFAETFGSHMGEFFLCLVSPFVLGKLLDWLVVKLSKIENIRHQFDHEWIWRLFLLAQVIGMLLLVRLDISQYNWDFFFDFFESKHWHYGYHANYNEIALLSLLGPFVITKTLDWIMAGRNKNP